MAKNLQKHKLKELDIVILSDGRAFQVVEDKPKSMTVKWMDSDVESFLFDTEKLYVEKIISNSAIALLVFNAARSIHQRLNNLNRV